MRRRWRPAPARCSRNSTVDNKDSVLTAGLYGILRLQVRRSNPVVLIPSQAVIFNKDGLSAAVVANGKVELRKLELEANNGANVEVRIGLRPVASS